MRTESIYLMIAIGLALGEEANRIFNNGIYRMKFPDRDKRMRRVPGSESQNAAEHERDDSYLEKLATQYEIIPLMSKLI